MMTAKPSRLEVILVQLVHVLVAQTWAMLSRIPVGGSNCGESLFLTRLGLRIDLMSSLISVRSRQKKKPRVVPLARTHCDYA